MTNKNFDENDNINMDNAAGEVCDGSPPFIILRIQFNKLSIKALPITNHTVVCNLEYDVIDLMVIL